ncbi:MAG: hypothetical protein WA099_03880 [Sulfuricurvum sp.]
MLKTIADTVLAPSEAQIAGAADLMYVTSSASGMVGKKIPPPPLK